MKKLKGIFAGVIIVAVITVTSFNTQRLQSQDLGTYPCHCSWSTYIITPTLWTYFYFDIQYSKSGSFGWFVNCNGQGVTLWRGWVTTVNEDKVTNQTQMTARYVSGYGRPSLVGWDTNCVY